MTPGRMNASYKAQLIGNESCSVSKGLGKTYIDLAAVTRIDFDERVACFHSLSRSTLFIQDPVYDDDIRFWFPECGQIKKDMKPVPIDHQQVHESLECVIAMMMENELL